MDIQVKALGKKFFREWIFRKVDYRFLSGKSYAITGPNGSGKSTFLRTLCGSIPASEGSIAYKDGKGNPVLPDVWPKHLVYAAPYLDVIEEFTLMETLKFHFSFKNRVTDIHSLEDIAEKMHLQNSRHKHIKYFSSGMKQRLKLGLAFFTNSPIIFLDEPTSNLDFNGIDWYLAQIDKIRLGRLLIICSNQPTEYGFCDFEINISNFK